MNKISFTLGAFGIAMSLFITGCRSGGEKHGKTMWSIPSVKLSRAKEKDIVHPAEKANAEATAQLANERLNGHNPSVAVRDSSDSSLHPDPEEIASLSRLEGDKVPDWANGLPPAPESEAGTPSVRIAGEVNEEMLNMAKNAASEEKISPESGFLTAETPISGAVPPEPLPGPAIKTENAVAASASPTVTTGASGSSADIYNGELPASLDDLPTQLSPAGGPAGSLHAGSTMMELPETVADIPSSAIAKTPNSGNVQAAALVQGGNEKSAPQKAQPAALFMPGNINPQYPNAPAR